MKLKGKKAFVTGAGSDGIGRAIVRAFAEAGADVVSHYRRKKLTDAQIDELQALGVKVHQIQGDISTPEVARRLVRDANALLGGLDILVANAGMTERIPFLEITDDAFDHILGVNLHGTFSCCQEAARIMVDAGVPGRIIVVSSVNQDNIVPFQSHYCASKGGVKQLAKAMALELAPHAINVNLIAPAATLTDMVREKHESDPEWSRNVTRKYPLGRIALPEDFKGPAVFLASGDSDFITGTTVLVDGGFSLSH